VQELSPQTTKNSAFFPPLRGKCPRRDCAVAGKGGQQPKIPLLFPHLGGMRQKRKACRGGVAERGQGGVTGLLGYRRPGGGGQCSTPKKSVLQNQLDEAGVVKIYPHRRNPPQPTATAAQVIPSSGGSKATC
jgi:hypothetical protein